MMTTAEENETVENEKKAVVRLEKVGKKFGPLTIFEEISFFLFPGEFAFLVGPSGSGKTTLLRLIYRELLPTTGEIFLDEEEISAKISGRKLCEVRRKIGRVFQDLKIIQDRTAWENLMLAFQILGKSEKEVRSEAEQIFSLVGLEERMNLFPNQLSEGEKQRLGIARALVGEPEILLIDEPTSNLDPANTWQIMKLLDEINKKGIAVFLATHDEDLVDSLQRRVIEIGQGKLLRDEKKGGYSVK